MFGLTAAEAQVAIDIAAGRSVEDIAASRSVTRNTVRSQLKSIFDKTNTHRQLQLATLVAGLGDDA